VSRVCGVFLIWDDHRVLVSYHRISGVLGKGIAYSLRYVGPQIQRTGLCTVRGGRWQALPTWMKIMQQLFNNSSREQLMNPNLTWSL